MASSDDHPAAGAGRDDDIGGFESAVRLLFPGEPLEGETRDRLARSLERQWSDATAVARPRAEGPRATRSHASRGGSMGGTLRWLSLAAGLALSTALGWLIGHGGLGVVEAPPASSAATLSEMWVSSLRDGAPQLERRVRSGDEVLVHFAVDRPALGYVFALTSDLRVEPMSSELREVGGEAQLFAFEVSGFAPGELALVLVVLDEFRSSEAVLAAASRAARERTAPEVGLAENAARIIAALRDGVASDGRSVMLDVVAE